MKSINVRDLQKKIRRCIELSQKERVVVTRHGRPVALVTGVDGYDWEDLVLATSPEFCKLIEERRKQGTVPIEEAARRLKVKLPNRRCRRRPPARHG